MPGSDLFGTGFLVSDEGLILTCSHVIQSEDVQGEAFPHPEEVAVEPLAGGPVLWAKVVRFIPFAKGDIALLKLKESAPEGAVALKLGEFDPASKFRSFRTYGFPGIAQVNGLNGSGKICKERVDSTCIAGLEFLQLDKGPNITRGFSGAPIFNTGLVVGMAASVTNPDDLDRLKATAFAIPSEFIVKVCPGLSLHASPDPTSADEDNLILRLANQVNPAFGRPIKWLFPFIKPNKIKERDLHHFRKAILDTAKKSLQARHDGKLVKIEFQTKHQVIDLIKDRAKRLVFITGGTGAGKTTLLRDVTVALPAGNEKRIPMFLALASWNGQEIISWMAKTAGSYYLKDAGFVRQCLKQKKVIPCLDGFDEVDASIRMQLLEQLTALAKEMPVIVTCRKSVFDAVVISPSPGGFEEVYLAPLDEAQLSQSLVSGDKEGVLSILAELEKDFNKQQLAGESLKTPLMLSLVASFDKQELVSFSGNGSKEELFNQLWDSYEKRAIRDYLGADRREVQAFETALRVFLKKLAEGGAKTFYLAAVQPQWLCKQHRDFYFFVSRMLTGIITSVGAGFFMAGPFEFLIAGMITGLSLYAVARVYQPGAYKNPDQLPFPYAMFRQDHHDLNGKNKRTGRLINVSKRWAGMLYSLAFVGLLVFLPLLLYFGFTVPRAPSDMWIPDAPNTEVNFANTQLTVALFMAILYCLVFGTRVGKCMVLGDILPIRARYPNVRYALLEGSVGGLLLSVLLAVGAHLVVGYFPGGAFAAWLSDTPYSPTQLGFITGLLFGIPVFGALGLFREQPGYATRAWEEQGFALFPYLIKMLLLGSIVVIGLSVYFGALLYLKFEELGAARKGIAIAFGTTGLLMLWLGGTDMVHHWVLRRVLLLENYINLPLKKMFSEAERLRLIVRSGAGYSFYHETLRRRYQSMPQPNHVEHTSLLQHYVKMTVKALAYLFFIGTPLMYVLYSLVNRPWPYWENEHQGIRVTVADREIRRIKPNVFLLTRAGVLRIAAGNRINVGNLSGYSLPEGTPTGLLGFNMNTWNVVREYNHAALLYRLPGRELAVCFPGPQSPLPWVERVREIGGIRAGDTIALSTNDTEWQNNRGYYAVKLSYAP